MNDSDYAPLLERLRAFVRDEQQEAQRKLLEVWRKPIVEKLETGRSQRFRRLERADDLRALWAYPDEGDSRFREGDLLALHLGSPVDAPLGRQLALAQEDEQRWLLRGDAVAAVLKVYAGGPCYADPDAIDLTPFYELSISEIVESPIGRDVVLPLLAGTLDPGFAPDAYAEGERRALLAGLNRRQAEAVGLAFGAEPFACIQGPPGTGKTRVLALAVCLMAEQGARVLVTSHTHMAINNALNKVHELGVPCVKVGGASHHKGLTRAVDRCESLAEWEGRRTSGYAVGATPFATCGRRLAGCAFDAVVFDEASQITVPLALMGMRKGKRFIFIGDQKQLPPVVLSRSVLANDPASVFSALTSRNAEHTVMLDETYRMNRWLASWPSRTYYDGALTAVGPHRERRLLLSRVPERLAAIFDPEASGVFVPTRDREARTRNLRDAELVAELCAAAVDGGIAHERIGVVTPYRAQGKAIRNLLAREFGGELARRIVADTVERMQGQERELVIVSLATGDPTFLAAVAPFFYQPERLNVSITRAISKLIVIGPEANPLSNCRPAAPKTVARPRGGRTRYSAAGGQHTMAIELCSHGDVVGRWIEQYLGLLRHLKRVVV